MINSQLKLKGSVFHGCEIGLFHGVFPISFYLRDTVGLFFSFFSEMGLFHGVPS